MAFEKLTLGERPQLEGQVHRLNGESWPTFLMHSDMTHWGSLFDAFTDHQILFCEPVNTVIAVGLTLPFIWDGTIEDLPPTLPELMDGAMDAHRNGSTPNALSALAALVEASHQRRGLSAEILRAMRSLAEDQGTRSFVAPVRPTLKSAYPLAPFERYVGWKRDDGLPFDPWLCVHHRLGAEPLKVMPRSLVVAGRISEWQEWVGMSFPESGPYVVPGALHNP